MVLERKAERLEVIVEDDGRGFNPGPPPDRALRHPGTVRTGRREHGARVAPRTGTALFVHIPIAPAESRASRLGSVSSRPPVQGAAAVEAVRARPRPGWRNDPTRRSIKSVAERDRAPAVILRNGKLGEVRHGW